MFRKLFANISLVVLLNILVKPLWILTENIVHDAVGHEAWGTYTALFSFAFLFISLSDLGINQYATKSLAAQPELMKSYFPNLFTFKLLLIFLYPILMYFTGWLWGYRSYELYLLVGLSLIHGGNQLLSFFRANLQAAQRFKRDGLLSVLDKVILMGLVIILLLTYVDITRFVYMRLLSIGLTIVFAYVLLSRTYGWLRPRLDRNLITKLVKESLPFALITILYSIHDKVDQVMLERMSGEVETSLYAGAYRWLDAFSMYLWITLAIFFAKFAHHIRESEVLSQLMRMGQRITTLPLVYVSIFMLFYSDKLLFLFTHSTEEQIITMSQSLSLLGIAMLINALFAIYSALLTSTGNEKPVNYILLLGISVNIVLNLIFIPEFGALAAAASTIASFAVVSIIYVFYVHFKLEVKVPFDLLGKLILSAALLYGIFHLLQMTDLHWLAISAIAGVAFGLISLGLDLIPRKLKL